MAYHVPPLALQPLTAHGPESRPIPVLMRRSWIYIGLKAILVLGAADLGSRRSVPHPDCGHSPPCNSPARSRKREDAS
jgi:hypothetical protein